MAMVWLFISALAFLATVTEGEIRGDMNFYYDPPSQYFLLQVTSRCYVAPLTREEKDHVHSRQGIEDLQQYFLLQVTSTCYVAPLTREEKDHVHSHQGIEDLQLTFVREWLGVLNETLIYHTDPNLPVKFAEMCKSKDIYYINRKLPPSPSASSIIG